MDRLRAVVESSTKDIELAASRHILLGSYSPEMLLHIPICGLASTLLGAYLKRRHGIDTTMQIATLDELPSENATPLRHVLLRELESGAKIDPTYTQFMSLAGLSRYVLHDFPELVHHYPANKIAVIDKDDTSFGARYAGYVQGIIPSLLREYRDTRITPTYPHDYLLTHRIGPNPEIIRVYGHLWDGWRYEDMPDEPDVERDALINTLLDGIA